MKIQIVWPQQFGCFSCKSIFVKIYIILAKSYVLFLPKIDVFSAVKKWFFGSDKYDGSHPMQWSRVSNSMFWGLPSPPTSGGGPPVCKLQMVKYRCQQYIWYWTSPSPPMCKLPSPPPASVQNIVARMVICNKSEYIGIYQNTSKFHQNIYLYLCPSKKWKRLSATPA